MNLSEYKSYVVNYVYVKKFTLAFLPIDYQCVKSRKAQSVNFCKPMLAYVFDVCPSTYLNIPAYIKVLQVVGYPANKGAAQRPVYYTVVVAMA